MNVQETAGVLAYLGSAWPNWDMSDDNADVWGGELAPLNADVARDTARNLVRQCKFPPSIAEFLEEYRRIMHANVVTRPLPELPEGEDVPFDAPAEFAALREKLKDWSTRGHNHKGPEPCPVCAAARA